MTSERKIIRVADVMKEKYDVVDGLSTVRDVLEHMKHVETKCVIVDKRHDNDEYGIVVLADIARHVLAENKSPDRVSIYEVMTKPAVTINPEMDIRHASALFARLGLSRAPVVNGSGEIIGIVSHTDMVLKGLLHLI
ncbi:MAG: histidine kinase [Zetaproteobacteria bacterium CG12_big_fil_rev_8_21_14_0_65_54_13]|nr:MAG: histidine kinase [Zetaproteobacteria bacterium CG12_big_fil_rev_8_21_14_0_65_54_13]PIX54053.1 MAG: histidine kinase [Zetaproteobacteria bacterium CG_4_10_14_3_um_filter_54_28]PJA28911.1 MAG: histidine kinase [Zetaproteobacteria bacterium CG_4_9_14_3_um_filter_54_145]